MVFREGVFSATTEEMPWKEAETSKLREALILRALEPDANLAELSTYLKVGTTSLVLAMIEARFLPHDLSLEEPVEA